MGEKSIFQKMFIKPGMKVLVVNMPAELSPVYGATPEGVTLVDLPEPDLDVIHLFVTNQAEFESKLLDYTPYLKRDGSYWVCYPKLTSAKKADIHRDTIWKFSSNHHLKPIAMAAIDDTWSAFRLKFDS